MTTLPGQPQEDELDAIAKRRAALIRSFERPAERVATELQISRKLGVQPAVVEALPEEAARKARIAEVESQLESSQRLKRVFADPAVAAIAYDDVPGLTKVERLVGSMVDHAIGNRSLVSKFAKGFTETSGGEGAIKAAQDLTGNASAWVPPSQRVADKWVPDETPGAIPGALKLIKGNKTKYDEPDTDQTFAAKYLYPGFESLGRTTRNTIPLIAAGVAQGAPAGAPGMVAGAVAGLKAGLVASSIDTGFSAYDKARDRLGPGFAATTNAALQGSFEYWTERMGAAGAADVLKTVVTSSWREAAKPFLKNQAWEIGAEQFATLGQDYSDWALGVDGDKSFKDFLAERPEAALQTLAATLVQGGATAVTAKTVSRVLDVAGSGFRYEALMHEKVVEAEGTADALIESFGAARESLLRKRDEPTFVEVTNALADNSKIYIDGATLAQLPPEFAAKIPGVLEQRRALEDGGMVELTYGDLINSVAGTPYEQVIAESVRRTPDSLNLTEAREHNARPQEEILKQARAIIARAEDVDNAQAASNWVRDRIYSDLVATGVYSKSANRAYSELAAAFFTVFGQRSGAPNAKAFYEGGWANAEGKVMPAFDLRTALAGRPTTGDIVNQGPGLRLGEVALTGYHFSKAARTTLSGANYGTNYAGDLKALYKGAADKRLGKRIYFYANKGTGVRPEAGVGGVAHRAALRNIYDADQDALRLNKGDRLGFESAVLDAGFDGYVNRLDGTQPAQVVMLGDKTVQVEQVGPEVWRNAGQDLLAPAPRPSRGRDQVVDRIRANRALPAGGTRDSWVRALRIAGMNAEAAAVEAALPADDTKQLYKDQLVRAFIDATPAEVYGQRVSLRTPTPKAGRADPHLSTDLGLEYNLLADSAASGYVGKAVELFNTYSGFKTDKRQPVVKQLEEIVEQMAENLTALYYMFPEETQERSKLWYAGGRKLIEHLERRYGNTYTRPQLTAVMAVMSPGMDWFINVTLGERIVDIYTNQQATVWTPEMETVAQQWAARRKNKDDTAEKAAVRKAHVDRLRGTMLAQAETDYDAAIWTILYDRAHNPNTYRVVTPDGGWAGFETNNNGTNSAASFSNGIRPVSQAIRVLRDPSIQTISRALGESHKVRNFYNNLLDPDDPNSVTIDTHAVGAALVLPLSQSSKEVKDLFGGIGSNVLGLTGTYVIFAEAYRRAAERAGVLPREMQSVTWETVRALFPAAEKDGIVKATQGVWARYKTDELTIQEARDAVFEIALKGRQFPSPSWVGSASGLDEGAPGSSYTSELRGPRVEPVVGAAERGDQPGTGDADTGGTLGQRREQARADDFTRDGIAEILEKDGWAILTAADPGAQKATDAANEAAMEALRAELAARGLTAIPVVGKYGDVQPSYIVLGLREGEAEDLGAMFGQESILDRRGLVYMADGSITPTTGEVQVFDTPPDDFYTEIPSAGVYFSVGLNFETPDVSGTVGQREQTPTLNDDMLGGYTPSQRLITLTENANPSTFIHELAHFFFHVLETVASTDGAPQDVKDHFAQALKWFNLTPEQWAKMTFAQKEPYQERVARSWEQYQLEGKAPSVELQPLFRKLTAFMKTAYGNLKRFLTTRFTNTGGVDDTLGQYAGERSLQANLPALSTARDMETAGASAENIRLATGWFRGKFDKKWRYEFSDAGMSFRTAFADLTESKLFAEPVKYRLGDIIDHPALFEAYPDAADIVFVKRKGFFDFGGLQGWQSPERNEIGLTPYATDPIGTLAHEIQHWIQVKEGFATGGNTESAVDKASPEQLAHAGRKLSEKLDEGIATAAADIPAWKAVLGSVQGMDLTDAALVLKKKNDAWSLIMARAKTIGVAPSAVIRNALKDDPESVTLFAQYDTLTKELQGLTDQIRRALFGDFKSVFDLPMVKRNIAFAVEPIIQGGVPYVEGKVKKAEKDFVDLTKRKGDLASGSLEALKSELKKFGLGYELYKALAGEIEARDTATRRTMTRAERDALPAYDSEKNIPLDDVIVTYGQREGQEQGVTGEQLGLNDEIRRLFDWMIATDEQIAEMERLNGMVADEDATAEALEKLGKRSASALRWTVRARSAEIKARQSEADELREDIEARVRIDFETSPEYAPYAAKAAIEKAEEALREETKGEYGKARADWRKRYDAAAAFALDQVKGLWVDKPEAKGLAPTKRAGYLHTNRAAINDEVEQRMLQWELDNPAPTPLELSEAELSGIADALGYKSVSEMQEAVKNAQPLEKVIEAKVDQEMLEEHGDMKDQESIEQAANDAVHNEARARMVAAELVAQDEALAATEETGKTDRRGRKLTVRSVLLAAAQYAQSVVAQSRLRDFKANAWKHTGAERRAVRAWSAATKAGKTAEAIQAKKDQVLQNAAAKAFGDARQEARDAVIFFRKVMKGNDEKTVKSGRDPNYVNLARAILRAYGFENANTKRAEDYIKLVSDYDKRDGAIISAINAEAQANAKPLPDLTIDELRQLKAMIEALWTLASVARTITVDGVRINIDDAAKMLIAEYGEVPSGRVNGTISEAERQSWGLLQGVAALARVEQTMLRLDNGKYGPHWRIIFLQIKKAADAYREQVIALRRQWKEISTPVEADLSRPGELAAPELGGFVFGRSTKRSAAGKVLDWMTEIDGTNQGLGAVIHALLHRGNKSNTRKLIEGFGWGEVTEDGEVDTSKFDAFIQRLADEGVLRKEHMDFVQNVWNMLDGMRPGAQEAHRAVYGRYFLEVTAEPLQTPWGTYPGGYAPIVYEPLQNEGKDAQESADDAMEFHSLMPQPDKGFTIERTGAAGPLRLDLRLLLAHVDKVALFSNTAAPIKETARLVNSKELKAAMGAAHPTAQMILRHFLPRAGKQQVQTPLIDGGFFSRLANMAAKRTGLAYMAGNIINAAQNSTILLQAVKVGTRGAVRPQFMLAAANQWRLGPNKLAEQVFSMSDALRHRMDHELAVLYNDIQKSFGHRTAWANAREWAQLHAFFLQRFVDKQVLPLVFIAAYNQHMADDKQADGEEHTRAVEFAESVIRQYASSNLPEDVSRIETGDPIWRSLVQFTGWANGVFNTEVQSGIRVARELGVRRAAPKLIGYHLLYGMLLPVIVGEVIASAFKGEIGDDEDEDGWWVDDFLRKTFVMGTIKGALSPVPLGGAMSRVVAGGFTEARYDDTVRTIPWISTMETALTLPGDFYKKILDDRGSWQYIARDAGTAATMLTGVPFTVLSRPLSYGIGIAEGRIEPTGPVDVVRGVVTGVASPESKQR